MRECPSFGRHIQFGDGMGFAPVNSVAAKRQLYLLVAVWVAVLGSVGCANREGPQLDRVVYAGSAWYGHAPIWVGQRTGIFERHGFLVEDRAFGGSADRINALIADNAQFASLGEVGMLSAMAAGRRGFYWVGSQNVAPGNEGLVAIGIDSIADLRGKRIALYRNTSVHVTVALLLRDAGIDIRSDVEILNAPDSAVIDLVRSGEAHAGAVWEPFFTDLRQLDGARLLATDMDTAIYRKFKSMTGPDVTCASKTWVDADRERAERFLRAYFEAVSWCADHPEELVDIVASEVRQPRASIEAALGNFHWIGWDGQKAMMSDARLFGQASATAQVLIDIGTIREIPRYRDWTYAGVYWK